MNKKIKEDRRLMFNALNRATDTRMKELEAELSSWLARADT